MASIARKQKRMNYRDAGLLKTKNTYSRFSTQGIAWYSKMAEEGKYASEAYQKFVSDSIGEQLETMLNSLKETWSEIGYNPSEIKLLEEAWSITSTKDSSTYRDDKKLANSLRKEAKTSLLSRLS